MHLDSITLEKSNQWWKIVFILGLCFFLLAGLVFFVFKSYRSYQKSPDLFVDNNYHGWLELGLEKYPYKSISKAIQSTSHKKTSSIKIHIKNGEYIGNIEIPENTEIYGENRDRVILKNIDPMTSTVTLKNHSAISNLTVTGGFTGILVQEQATVENCSIKEFEKIGISAAPSDSEIIIRNSEVFNGSGKAFYLQTGRKIQIIGNVIHNNKEEGIDLRQDVSGRITNNQIYENGESGIELIVGKSSLKIEGNNILDNESNGITCQYYKLAQEKGDIIISANHIRTKDPKNYTISVGNPQGDGGKIADYWKNSITITDDNIMEGVIKKRSLEITPSKKS